LGYFGLVYINNSQGTTKCDLRGTGRYMNSSTSARAKRKLDNNVIRALSNLSSRELQSSHYW